MADKDEGLMSMSELRERQRTDRAKRKREAAVGLDESFIHTLNMSSSILPSTPKRSNSFVPSKSGILRRLQSLNPNSNVSFLAGQMEGASLNNMGLDRSSSFVAARAVNRSLANNRSFLGREASFNAAVGQQDDNSFNILDDSMLSVGEPDLNHLLDLDPFKKARTGREAPPALPRQPSHQLYRTIALNPFEILNKISLGEDRDCYENTQVIPSFGCKGPDVATLASLRRELSALKVVERPPVDGAWDSSDSEAEIPSLCVDSDDDFHSVPASRQQDPVRPTTEKTPEPEKNLEEKVDELLRSYRPASALVGNRFNVSRQIPLELSIKETCTFLSQSSLGFLVPPAQAELQAHTRYSPDCHSFSSWKSLSASSATLYQVLTTHHYPAAPRPKYLATKTNEYLSLSRARNSKLTPDQTEMLAEFAAMEAEWQDTFTSLFTACMADVVPYFYYVNSDFSVCIASPTATQDIGNAHQTYGVYPEPSPVAFLHGATPGLTKLLASKKIAFSVATPNPSGRNPAPPKSVPKDRLKKFEKAVKPPKGSQLLFEGHDQLKALFRFLLDWKNPKQELRCQGPPDLIAPTPFKRSQARVPKITHIETRATDPHFTECDAQDSPAYELKIDGLVLPSALKVLVQRLLTEQAKAFAKDPATFQFSEFDPRNDDGSPRNEFQFKAFLKPHLDTLGLSGRWILPAASLPYAEPSELFDQGTAMAPPGPGDFVIPSAHLATFLYFATRFFW